MKESSNAYCLIPPEVVVVACSWALVVYECLSEWGQILCAICPNLKLVITGGTSTAICVWETGTSKERAKALTLKQALLGHTDAVTCLTASSAYHIVVSGSRDRTCIIWDLNKLSFVTQLRGHRAPVSALCINELTGDIVSCAGTHIHVWSINGSPIASANTFTGRSQQILCCCVSEMNEWDTQNVIVTGHSDGVVRFWRMEFLQVPETPAPQPVEPDVPDCCADEKIEGGVSQNGEEDSSESDGDEPSLSQEPKAPHNPSAGGSQPVSAVHRPRGPPARPGASWSMDSSSDDSHRWSDSLSVDEKDGFVFVNYSEGQTKVPHPGQGSVPQPLHPSSMDPRAFNQLRTGYRWERQLVFRSKLTMHTAFDRKDNAQPAEITSLAISKDHSKIPGGGRARSGLQLVGERAAGPLGSRPLGEGRGGGQLLRLHRALLPHRAAPPLQELWTALLSEVQSLPVGDQEAEDLVSGAGLSELLLQPSARAKRRGRLQKLSSTSRNLLFLLPHVPQRSPSSPLTLYPLVRPVTRAQ
ncbi:WD repeat and FYVE domain-containing protein 3-like [Notothenia coriiceps]|uniref:WD repeat and FYVE domain-containing protein 3-like n=1 Tax=Notothenia coriiceps TaxID=8208 RepID=A0A6I9NTH2_9TELE|nr:PREDICTED: WD repeat and FYVE domain-containing protein 3-like [Notothenia coriiceps]